MLRGEYMWYESNCVVVGGAEDSVEIPIVVKLEEG